MEISSPSILMFCRSADIEMDKNVAYSRCDGAGGEKTDISGGQGNGETRTNDTTIL